MSEQRPLLTQAEVNALPEGTLIEVIWSGGNGPHRYRVEVDQHGMRRAAGHWLEGVGEKPQTEVRLSSGATDPVERLRELARQVDQWPGQLFRLQPEDAAAFRLGADALEQKR